MLILSIALGTKLALFLPLVLQVELKMLEAIESVPLKVGDETIPRVRYEMPVEIRLDGMELPKNAGLIERFRQLKILSLRGTDVERWHLERWTEWRRLEQLEFIDLSSTRIAASDLTLLTRLPKLRTVCLVDVGLSPEDISRFKEQYKRENGRELLVGYSRRGEGNAVEEQSGLICCQSDQRRLVVLDADAATEADMKPYDELIEHTDVRIRMVPIPGGEFRMGSPAEEPKRSSDEGPQREVSISPFWMAETETTWGAFQVWMYDLDVEKRKEFGLPEMTRDRRAEEYQVSQPEQSYYKEDMGMGFEGRPAIRMTQLAARTYCQWLSAKTGRYYRLPTEAEWEYACRAGTTTAYSWGDDPALADQYAWYYDNTDEASATGKVRQKKPNPWGLYDMHGNVSEWVLDQFEPDYYERSGTRSTDPLNVPQTLYPRVVRGGSFWDDVDQLRSANRQASSVEWMNEEPRLPHGIWWFRGSHFWFGFRMIRPLEEPDKVEKRVKWAAQVPSDERKKYLKQVFRHSR